MADVGTQGLSSSNRPGALGRDRAARAGGAAIGQRPGRVPAARGAGSPGDPGRGRGAQERGIATMRTLRRIVVMALMALALPARAQDEVDSRPPDLDSRPAIDAGDAWLLLVDTGRYGDSWEAAAPNFKDALSRVQWEVAVSEAREKVGVLV